MTRMRWILHRLLGAAGTVFLLAAPASAAALEPEGARAQAEEAFILLYPALEVYRAIDSTSLDDKSSEWRAPLNRFSHQTQLIYPASPVRRPNNDVLVSTAALDLRREPLVLSIPALPRQRHFSFYMVDINGRAFGLVDSAGKSQLARDYLIANPAWKGHKPKGISEVFRATANFALITGRTVVDGARDLPAASGVLRQYTLTPLSEFLGAKAPRAPPKLKFPPYDPTKAASAGFITYANFLLSQTAISPEHKALLKKFRPIGLYPGRSFDADKLNPAIRQAMDDGVAAALARIEAATPELSARRNGWSLTGSALERLEPPDESPLVRAAAAMLGLWDESVAVVYTAEGLTDEKGEAFSAFRHNYTLIFPKDQLPPADGFWSLTIYAFPSERLVENSVNRYSVGSRSPDLKYETDGSLTLYIQYKSPGGDREANWLPAPNGPFALTLRMYSPKTEALSPPYAPPPVRRP